MKSKHKTHPGPVCLRWVPSAALLLLINLPEQAGCEALKISFPPPERWIKGLKLHQQIALGGVEWKEGSVEPLWMAEAAGLRLLF